MPEDPQPKSRPPVLTVKQAARALRVHEQTFRDKLDRGEQPGYRVGRVWRIPRQAFCAQNGIPDDYDFDEE